MLHRREFVKHSLTLASVPFLSFDIEQFYIAFIDPDYNQNPLFKKIQIRYQNNITGSNAYTSSQWMMGMINLYQITREIPESSLDKARVKRMIIENLNRYENNYDPKTIETLKIFRDPGPYSNSVFLGASSAALSMFPTGTVAAATGALLSVLWDPTNKVMVENLGFTMEDVMMLRMPGAHNGAFIKRVNEYALGSIHKTLLEDGKLSVVLSDGTIKNIVKFDPKTDSLETLLSGIPAPLRDITRQIIKGGKKATDKDVKDRLVAEYEKVTDVPTAFINDLKELIKAQKNEQAQREIAERDEYVRNELKGGIDIIAFIFQIGGDAKGAEIVSKSGSAILNAVDIISRSAKLGPLAIAGGLLNSFNILASLFSENQTEIIIKAIRQVEENIKAQLSYLEKKLDLRFEVIQEQQRITYKLLADAYNEIVRVSAFQEVAFKHLIDQIGFGFNAIEVQYRQDRVTDFNVQVEDAIALTQANVPNNVALRPILNALQAHAISISKNTSFSLAFIGAANFAVRKDLILKRGFLRYCFGTFPFFNSAIQNNGGLANPVEWMRGTTAYLHFLAVSQIELKPQNHDQLNALLAEGLHLKNAVASMTSTANVKALLVALGECIGFSKKTFTDLGLTNRPNYKEGEGLLKEMVDLLTKFESEKLNKTEYYHLSYTNADDFQKKDDASKFTVLSEIQMLPTEGTKAERMGFTYIRNNDDKTRFLLIKNHPFHVAKELGLIEFKEVAWSPGPYRFVTGEFQIKATENNKKGAYTDRYVIVSYDERTPITIESGTKSKSVSMRRGPFMGESILSQSIHGRTPLFGVFDELYQVVREDDFRKRLGDLSTFLKTNVDPLPVNSKMKMLLGEYEKQIMHYYVIMSLVELANVPVHSFSGGLDNQNSILDSDKLHPMDIAFDYSDLADMIANFIASDGNSSVAWMDALVNEVQDHLDNHFQRIFYNLYSLIKTDTSAHIAVSSIETAISSLLTFMSCNNVKVNDSNKLLFR